MVQNDRKTTIMGLIKQKYLLIKLEENTKNVLARKNYKY